MANVLRVLILEDRPADAHLMLHELRRAGFEPDWKRLETEEDFLARLGPDVDVILADYSLPQFDALRALDLLRQSGLDVPCVVITGALGDEAAVECLKRGAADYLLKDRLARLGRAVEQALGEVRLRRDKRRAEAALRRAHDELEARVRQRTAELEGANRALREEVARRVQLQGALADKVRQLEETLAQVNTLQGLLPICCYCKKVRDDRNYWHQVEDYVRRHTEVRFSHGICPDCWEHVVEPQLQQPGQPQR
jgi:DNA-binding NtrC family response regulator